MHTTPLHPSRLGFDIDGVVADTMEAFIRIAREEFGIGWIRPEQITSFEVAECLDMDAGQADSIFGRLMADPLAAGLRPMPGAVGVLQEFAGHGPLTFITARPDREPIDRWLREILGPAAHGRTRLIATGEHDGKLDHVRDLGLTHFVDDRAETCLQLHREGIVPLVYSQPWNRGRHQLSTVEDWQAIRALCLA